MQSFKEFLSESRHLPKVSAKLKQIVKLIAHQMHVDSKYVNVVQQFDEPFVPLIISGKLKVRVTVNYLPAEKEALGDKLFTIAVQKVAINAITAVFGNAALISSKLDLQAPAYAAVLIKVDASGVRE